MIIVRMFLFQYATEKMRPLCLVTPGGVANLAYLYASIVDAVHLCRFIICEYTTGKEPFAADTRIYGILISYTASMNHRRVLSSRRVMWLLVLAAIVLNRGNVDAAEDNELPGCSGNTCPTPVANGDFGCGLWLGPSPIKNAENHGFGLGVFTGRSIPKGSVIESIYSNGGEVLVPIFSSKIHSTHPPLREYVWDDANLPDIETENSHGTSFYFIPGVAAIVPCTSKNFNLVLSTTSSFADSGGVHRAKHPAAGSFSYRHNVTYTAVRDLVPGEELTVFCDDDDFDGGDYFLSTYQATDDTVVCLDDNLRIKSSSITGVGEGLFSKQRISKGSLITSTPLIPIHRKELDIIIRRKAPTDMNPKQLLLNYCFGHPDSDLLLLPYGPMVNHLNHGSNANAVIRWHTLATDNAKEPRRQQFHHPELLEWSADKVADTHGVGLMMDIVALRNIMPNEEIVLDYGADWTEAYKIHVSSWPQGNASYTSAAEYIARNGKTFRTEQEQQHDPYPENLRVTCFYDKHIGKDKTGEAYSKWNENDLNACVRPCSILGRQTDSSADEMYTVQMTPAGNEFVYEWCELNTITVVSGMPHHAIRLSDRPETADMFLPSAFRHEIGVPDGFYPETWMKKKLRRQPKSVDSDGGASFKRKQATTTTK